MSLTTKLIRIGNSRGIRLPKSVIDESGLTDQASLTVRGSSVIITPTKETRRGWAAAAKLMHARGDDHLEQAAGTSWDQRDWQW